MLDCHGELAARCVWPDPAGGNQRARLPQALGAVGSPNHRTDGRFDEEVGRKKVRRLMNRLIDNKLPHNDKKSDLKSMF